MRRLSRFIPLVICVFGAFTLLSVLYVLAAQNSVFPDRVPRYMWAITAHSRGETQAEAVANILQPQQRASDFLEQNGFPAKSIAINRPILEKAFNESGGITWDASQDVSVPADSYGRFARLSNRLDVYQKGRDDLTWSFPAIPFEAFVNFIAFATIGLLCFSVFSLETRSADVARAPRGMHPVMVSIQTMASGSLVLVSLVETHMLPLQGPRVLPVVLAIGVVSIAAWLYKTRGWWKDSRFMRAAYACYVVTLVAIIGFGVYAVMAPVT